MQDGQTAQDQLLAPCGLYCGFCGVYLAHQAGDQKMKGKLAGLFGCAPEEVACQGCLSDQRFFYCASCAIRSCTQDRGYEGCYQCDEFPCSEVERFPIPVGKQIILQEVPRWRELGTDAWLADQMQKHTCPDCGQRLIRGGKVCPSCRRPVSTG